jgi:hypothetical protein
MSVFGGLGDGKQAGDDDAKTGWFEGYLRALRILHRPE